MQAAGEPPSETSPEIQSKPVELTLELGAAPTSTEANSSTVPLPAEATRGVLGGSASANGDCGDGVCDGDENCGNCAADCGECACANVFPGDCDDANIGILGDFIQECGDGGWTSLAFPIETGGGMIDTIAVHLATNRAGGDVYIMGAAGCQPDTSNILASLCCALSGLTPNASHELHFDAVMTSADEPTWVVLVERTGLARTNNLGFFNGETFKAFGLGRSNLEPTLPNRAFANLSGTGNPGDWIDLHYQGAGLGSPYCVGLSVTGQDPGGPYDCVANSDLTGGCCNVEGDECQTMRGFECGIAGGVYLGDGTTCDACLPACNVNAGDCCIVNHTPGCDDPMCCHYVCLQDPFCCGADGGDWDQACAVAANDPYNGCGQPDQACEPTSCVDDVADSIRERIRTGPDPGQDGALGILLDEYGAFARCGFDECDYGDMFNPDGPLPAAEAVYGSALFFYKADTKQRVILSALPIHANIYPVDSSAFAEIPEGSSNTASDTNGDGVNDTLASAFAVCGPGDLALDFQLMQTVEQVTPVGGGAVSVLTQAYTITNVSATPIEFVLLRQDDYDMFWVGSNTDDFVGTMTNGNPDWDRNVYQFEGGLPETAITLSSPQGVAYYGAKGGVDPDGLGGPGVPYGCGTDFQQWDAYGLPIEWTNHIANVGYHYDGESGPSIPGGCGGGCDCEASIGLSIPVSLSAGASTCICVVHTYGQRTPIMGTCPEGCSGGCGSCPTDVDDDGHTGPFDLAMLLGSWGPVTQDSVCLDADQNVLIDAFDLAVLLANWGACE